METIIRKCAQEVYEQLGDGYQECVYQSALEYELQMCHLPYTRQPTFPIHYKDTVIGTYRPDLLICNQWVVELKSIKTSPSAQSLRMWSCQLHRYLKQSNQHQGMLIIFGMGHVIIKIQNANSATTSTQPLPHAQPLPQTPTPTQPHLLPRASTQPLSPPFIPLQSPETISQSLPKLVNIERCDDDDDDDDDDEIPDVFHIERRFWEH